METLAAVAPTAFGFGEFTILAAATADPAAPAAPAAPVARPASAVPTLANTGSDNGPLVALGAGLLVLAAGAYRMRSSLR